MIKIITLFATNLVLLSGIFTGNQLMNTMNQNAMTKTAEITEVIPEETEIENETEKSKEKGYIFVGDSRTVGMSKSINKDTIQAQHIEFIAEVGIGISMMNKAETEIQEIIKRNPNIDYTIICNLGVNDLYNYQKYAEKYNEWNKLYNHFYVVSVNPVRENKSHNATMQEIQKFNQYIEGQDLQYINTCDQILDSFYSSDGLHYNKQTYNEIYSIIMDEIEKKEKGQSENKKNEQEDEIDGVVYYQFEPQEITKDTPVIFAFHGFQKSEIEIPKDKKGEFAAYNLIQTTTEMPNSIIVFPTKNIEGNWDSEIYADFIANWVRKNDFQGNIALYGFSQGAYNIPSIVLNCEKKRIEINALGFNDASVIQSNKLIFDKMTTVENIYYVYGNCGDDTETITSFQNHMKEEKDINFYAKHYENASHAKMNSIAINQYGMLKLLANSI